MSTLEEFRKISHLPLIIKAIYDLFYVACLSRHLSGVLRVWSYTTAVCHICVYTGNL